LETIWEATWAWAWIEPASARIEAATIELAAEAISVSAILD